MKRIWVVLLVLVLAAGCLGALAESAETPSSMMFGQYEQDNKTENGREPIEWTVLAVQDGKALLVTRYALDCAAVNEQKEDMSWEASGIRSWLNGEFFTAAFNESEQQAVLLTSVPNTAKEGNADYDPVDRDATEDRVFLLSCREIMEYLPKKDSRKLTGTAYARSKGARFGGFTSIGIGETDWWTRSPGKDARDAAFINVYGNIDTKSVDTRQGIRPAIWIDLGQDSSGFLYETFARAVALADEGNYAEAVPLIDSLGDYNNSKELAKKYRYLWAVQAQENGDHDQVITLCVELDGYEDTHEMGREARYLKAVSYQEAGDYASAIKYFGEVGQYKDSMARLKTCFEKQGVSQFYFSVDAVSTGVDNGYSNSEVITSNDRHFGWRLGRFFISDFTRVIDNTGDCPVFIKTLGDSVTLWFDLEQDIDALNGNTNLIISEDKNGLDQTFGVQKTNFGRGTLIVRHTDYQNKKGDPVIYTDYLLAKGTTGADTKVVLNEEGDYEVALDYEIQDNDFKHVTYKYGNYRILFRFSVRNGNCMVYPFDAVTKAELQNTAVTENGFYLDLARSRYLDIDVRRSVIVDGPAGPIEDERFNRPARDGDQYTQEGIYTISVRNRYTGESTVKTIFVGTNELLQEYIAKGFSMDRLK